MRVESSGFMKNGGEYGKIGGEFKRCVCFFGVKLTFSGVTIIIMKEVI
ncbi:hypothetical protein BN2127_JRS1_03679 [Bacillus cereus]|nr:hypothetical protein BN2127_JRS1_03679 [Bacillus cereus]